MRKIYYLIVLLFVSSFTFGQTLLTEDFDYPEGDSLTAHGWVAHSSPGLNTIKVTSPGLTFPGYVGSGVGNAAGLENDGEKVNKKFGEQITGAVYAFFLVNATATSASGDYFFHFADTAISTAHRARTFILPASTEGKMKVGFSFNKSTPQDTLKEELNFGETYLFVAKYQIRVGDKNDSVYLYVFKAGDNFSVEPATPTLKAKASSTSITDINPAAIVLRQFDAAQRITVDGFRVCTSWVNFQAPNASFNPADTETNVEPTVTPTITFDEAIRNIDDSEITDENVAALLTLKKTDASGDDVPFTATISDDKKVITITPSSKLDFNQTYYLAVAPVEDVFDNAAATHSIRFTTRTGNTDATVTSSVYMIDNEAETISDIPNDETLDNFKTNITPAVGASFEVYEADGITVANDLQTGYKLICTAEDGITKKIYTITLQTGISNNPMAQLNVYPNPFTDRIYFTGAKVTRITIISLIGQVLMDRHVENTESIDVSSIERGIYLVRFYNKNGEMLLRMLVKQ